MSFGLLFVTASNRDHKFFNNLLLQLRDWEYDSRDSFTLVTTRNTSDVTQPDDSEPNLVEISPRFDNMMNNEWAGASLTDAEDFCLNLSRLGDSIVNADLFALVDNEGAQRQNCILCVRTIDVDAEDFIFTERFSKMRVPWDQIHTPCCNLNIADMRLIELSQYMESHDTNDESNSGERGWFTYRDVSPGRNYLGKDGLDRKAKAIERLRMGGRI